jgi:hypothetical protein
VGADARRLVACLPGRGDPGGTQMRRTVIRVCLLLPVLAFGLVSCASPPRAVGDYTCHAPNAIGLANGVGDVRLLPDDQVENFRDTFTTTDGTCNGGSQGGGSYGGFTVVHASNFSDADAKCHAVGAGGVGVALSTTLFPPAYFAQWVGLDNGYWGCGDYPQV